MKVLNSLPFVLDDCGNLGIAEEGTFAAIAWRLSDDAFNAVRGSKFSWTAPDGKSYVDDKSNFKRPTEEQIISLISPALQLKAIEQSLLSL